MIIRLIIIISLGIFALLSAPFDIAKAPIAEVDVAPALPHIEIEEVPQAPSEPESPVVATPIPEQSDKKLNDTSALTKIAEDIQWAKKQLENIRVPPSEPIRMRLSQESLYRIGSDSIVNFYCQKGAHITIATGVVIDPRGYVLTNAHIASEDAGEPTCVLRKGSPAEPYARAKRIFTAPNFSDTLLESENLKKDVAIWRITTIAHGATPTPIPAIGVDPDFTVTTGAPLSTFSYPAEFLGSQAIARSLYLSFSETTVTQIDKYFIESEHGVGSQKGSSGGVLIDPYTGTFAGLIFAVSGDETKQVSNRKMLSLTSFAIDQVVRNATDMSLAEYLSTNP